tara:strand:+ start:738 stop:1133 length:396 start_codon:yes stop_codon:yes gene_type:complete
MEKENCEEREGEEEESDREEHKDQMSFVFDELVKTCEYLDGVPKWTLQIKCRGCGKFGWYENIRDDYEGKPDYEYGECADCEEVEEDDDEKDDLMQEEAYRQGRKDLLEDMVSAFPEMEDKIIELYEKKIE